MNAPIQPITSIVSLAGGRWCAGLVWAGRDGGERDNRHSTIRCPAGPGHPAPTPRLTGKPFAGAGAGVCDGSTCIAAGEEDHDPAACRDHYHRYARVALLTGGVA